MNPAKSMVTAKTMKYINMVLVRSHLAVGAFERVPRVQGDFVEDINDLDQGQVDEARKHQSAQHPASGHAGLVRKPRKSEASQHHLQTNISTVSWFSARQHAGWDAEQGA